MHKRCIQASIYLVLGSCGHANLFLIAGWFGLETAVLHTVLSQNGCRLKLSATFGDMQRSMNPVLNFGKEGTAQ